MKSSGPGIDGVLFDLGNTLIPFTPRDSMEFVLKWYFTTPGLEEQVPFPDFLETFRSVVREEKGRMRSMRWETNVATRSSMMETMLLDQGFDVQGLSGLLGATHTGAFTSCLRMGSNSRYVLNILSSMRGRGGAPLKLGLVSNAGDGDAIRRFLDRNELNGYFKSIVISGEVGIAKPWEDIFMRALSEMGLEPGTALYVGDRYEIDVLGARSAGMKAVYIRQYHTAGEPPEGIEIDAVTIENLLDLVPLIENGDI
ncbi:MAG: HAD family hydrolase [Thermoplasmatota archaeon]